ncbi:hypothetical protein KF728_27960 [Candidatus Obscuribacterales bacterium]|nr:hypothetical protein [Candidatus Obscuribacterales bacterium]
MQSGTQEISTPEQTVAPRPALYILRFLVSWLVSLVVVLAVTLLSDVNWSRPYLEQRLSDALERQVRLGKVTWALGLNGISVETKNLQINEITGEPFLSAAESEIGVSVLALLEHKIVVTFVRADKANIRLVKTSSDKWNFDDLLKPGPEIRLLQLTSAKLGLFDESADSKTHLAPINLEKVELKLNFPHKNRKRPFFLSFSLPSKGYSTTFELEGLGVGELEKWQSNQYSFKADAKRVNPRDVERLMKFITVPTTVDKDGKEVIASAGEEKKRLAATSGGKKKQTLEEIEHNRKRTEAAHKTATKSGASSKPSEKILSRRNSSKSIAVAKIGKSKETESEDTKNVSTTIETVDGQVVSVDPKQKQLLANQAAEGLIELVKPIKGLFDFALQGDGTFDKGIKATFDTEADNVLVDHPTVGVINAGKTVAAVTASLSKDALSWQDLKLKMHGLEIHSSGEVSHWQEKEPGIKANLNGVVPDIGVLQDILVPKTDNVPSRGLSNLARDLKPARLSGRADIAIKIDGTTRSTNMTTSVKTYDLAIKEMLSKANQHFPLLCAVGLSSQAKIQTDLKVENADRIDIINGKLVGPGTNLNASGWIDLKTNKSKLVVNGDRIQLRDTALGITTNEAAYKQIMGSLKLPGKNSFTLDGTANANATLTADGDRYLIDGKLKLNDAAFALKDNSLKLNHVNGNVLFTQNNSAGHMTLSGFTGQMGDGHFQMDGKLSLAHTPVLDTTIHATRFDLKHLATLMKIFQIQIPVLTEHQLYGRVKDVVLKVSGTAFNPKISFSAVPDDLYYQPPGLAKPLRAKAGVIVYDNDQLILREVALVTNNKTIVTSLTMDRVSKDASLSRVKMKTDSIELADLNYYLSSTAMPPPLRKAYHDFLAQYKISGMHGKSYGDILCLISPKGDVTFDGLVGLYKAGATVSGFPLTKLEGIFAASGDQLLLQDVSGFLRGSKFSLDGYIDKYKSKNPTWRAEVAATLAPRELLELVPHVAEELKASEFKVTSKGPLTLRSKVQGSFDYLKAQYSLIADKSDRMVVEGTFGKIYQPVDTPLTLDGLINIDKTKVDIGDTHLLVGDTLISVEGQVRFPENSAPAETSSNKHGSNAQSDSSGSNTSSDAEETSSIASAEPGSKEINTATKPTAKAGKRPPPIVKLTVKIPQKSPVKSLIAMVDPPLANDIKGTISGYVTVDGDLRNPKLLSDITVNDLDAKAMNITGLNARLRSGGAPDKEGDEPLESTESLLEVDSVKVRQLPITNLKAHVGLIPGKEVNSTPVINIDQGQAKLADGAMTFEARFDPADNNIWAKASFTDISAARVGDELIGHPDEISGKGHATVEVVTKGDDYHQMLKNLKGHGNIQVEDGVVARFSDLQTRLTQYNLLTQGIFGFNFNNLLQSVWPVRSGEFNTLNNSFAFEDGLLKVEELRFSGKDMRIWGSGYANLENNQVKLEMAGKIPRVQGSMLGGSVGNASRNITLQKAMKMLTFGKLQNLPTLPVLGAIATDKPRTFMFNVDSTLDNPKTIARSIEKTFKWLANKPDATAHPVPGLVNPN